MRRIKITYDVVTPESAEQGDYADQGWVNEEGEPIEPDEYDIDEHGSESAAAVHLATKRIGKGAEPSSWPTWFAGTWYIEADGTTDYRTMAVTRESFHLYGFTPDEEREIYRLITGR